MGASESRVYPERMVQIGNFVKRNSYRVTERLIFLETIEPGEKIIFENSKPNTVTDVEVIENGFLLNFEKLDFPKKLEGHCIYIQTKDSFLRPVKILRFKNSLSFLMTEEEIPEIENYEITGETFFRDVSRTLEGDLDFWNSSGVVIGELNKEIIEELSLTMKFLKKNIPIDYHPGSGKRVRDIVHPSLYPFIENETKAFDLDQLQLETIKSDKENIFRLDLWKRKHEKSKYQWLPSEFDISETGACKIVSRINNLDENMTSVYKNLEKLFTVILPEMEKVVSFALKSEPAGKISRSGEMEKLEDLFVGSNPEDGDFGKCETSEFTEIPRVSLRGRRLQVIPKIVTVEMKDNDIFEGAWHVEGMSHEHIVATCVCVVEQENIESQLFFKKELTECEGEYLYEIQGQYDYFQYFSEFIDNDQIPLGCFKSKKGSYVIFPNSHIHKLDLRTLKKNGRRSIIVFWLIDPNVRVISTQNVPVQNYPLSVAKERRKELMKDRTYYKQSFNARKINLCEH